MKMNIEKIFEKHLESIEKNINHFHNEIQSEAYLLSENFPHLDNDTCWKIAEKISYLIKKNSLREQELRKQIEELENKKQFRFQLKLFGKVLTITNKEEN